MAIAAPAPTMTTTTTTPATINNVLSVGDAVGADTVKVPRIKAPPWMPQM